MDEAYQDQYAITRDALQAQPTGKQFELNENVIFGKLEVFCRRLLTLTLTLTQTQTLTPQRVRKGGGHSGHLPVPSDTLAHAAAAAGGSVRK